MGKIQAPVIMNEAPASDEYGIVVRPVGGSGSAVDATIVAPLPLPVTIEGPLGSRPSAESVSVALASDQIPLDVNASISIPNPLPVTLEDQLATGTLDGASQTVELELNGAKGASCQFADAGNFNGTVVFEAQYGAGSDWEQIQANNTFTWTPCNRVTGAVQPSNYTWRYALSGGETAVRVRSITYNSGSSDIILSATQTDSSPIQSALGSAEGGDATTPMAGIVLLGRDGSRTEPIASRSDNEASNKFGLITRDMAGTRRIGDTVIGADNFGKVVGGRDAGELFRTIEIRDVDPASDDNGVVTRNIPSGIQEVSGTVSVNEPVAIDEVITDTGNITLGALNDAVIINATGKNSVGCYFIRGTLNGTLVLEQSHDNTTWSDALAWAIGSITETVISSFLANSGITRLSIFTNGAGIFYRLRVSAYSSGSGSARMVASFIHNIDRRTDSKLNSPPSVFFTTIGGWDGTSNSLPTYVRNSTPNSGDNGLVVRPVTSNVSPVTRTFATVGVTSAIVVASNSVRKGLELVNTSPNRISLGIGTTAVLDSGITLYPRGSYVMDAHASYSSSVSAIASAAGSNLGIQEYNI